MRNFSLLESILDGINFDDLIDTVQCNVQEINEEAVYMEFNKILSIRLQDANNTLKANMQGILEELEKHRKHSERG
jgi:hypothetical protein